MVGDEDHGPLLDRHRDPLRGRLRALLPLLHRLPLSLPDRVLVLGLARSGRAAALALARRGVSVRVVDRAPEADPGRLAEGGVEVLLGTEEESVLDGVELIVKSPGVPRDSPLVAAAEARGVPIWSELELGYRILDNPLIGVTGTNGKTTTSEWLGAMLGAPVAGNVGRALCDLDGRVEAGAWVVCEVSSFQLEDVHEFRPRVAVLLNLEPDHLDRHGTFDAYRRAKLRIFENQVADDTAVVPRGFDPVPGDGRRLEFSTDDPLPAEPSLPGAHNRENAAAATAAARATGLDDARIADGLRRFRGVAHRLEPVGEVGGVRYVNDSKATNLAATRRALASYDAPLHLILGGYSKGEDFRTLELPANVRTVLLVGEAAPEIRGALGVGELVGDLARAVARAAELARPGDVVLLSPACASYDQFANFEQRGDLFRELVARLGP